MPEDISIEEAAARFAKSRRTILRWIQDGKIPAHKAQVDGHEQWRIDVDKVPHDVFDNTKIDVLKDVLAEKDRRIADLLAEIATLKAEIKDLNERLRESHILLQQQKVQQQQALPEPEKRRWWQFWK